MNVSLNGEMSEKLNNFKYLGTQIGSERGVKIDFSFRVGEAEGCRHSKKL